MPETDQQRIEREKRIDVAEDMSYELIGGCLSMAIVAERCGVDLDDALEESILNRAFQCQGCGWWHSIEELNNLTGPAASTVRPGQSLIVPANG